MISERPPEVADRAVSGHWEGGLIVGKENGSAIGTLVERSSRYVMLVHLPGTRGTASVRDALVETITTLPEHGRERLEEVAAELNSRPRETLGWETPAERLAKLLAVAS
ncbi:IS30 family transposase [Thermobifida halotolerans]